MNPSAAPLTSNYERDTFENAQLSAVTRAGNAGEGIVDLRP